MTRIALVGAGGFVGSRMLEMAALGHPALSGAELVPIIRQARGIARNSKLGLSSFVPIAVPDVRSLARAFDGCSMIVNLTMGDNSRILPDVQQMHEACRQAGVPAFLHVSSAEVFGRCDISGLTDDSPWLRGHWMPYARAKGEAEDWLRAQSGGPRVVVLRPGLVWGPRSPWVSGPAETLLAGTAWQIDGGRWACNLCHVDNLAFAIIAVGRSVAMTPGFYNVGDPDRPTWAEYWAALAREMGLDQPMVDLPETAFHESLMSRLSSLKDSVFARALKKRLHSATKERIKSRLADFRAFCSPRQKTPQVCVSKSLWWLQTTRYHLPISRFQLAYPSAVRLRFSEGMVATGRWLRFSGYGSGGMDV